MEVEAMKESELIGFNKYKEEFKVVFDVGARGNTEFVQIHPNCEYHLFEPQVRYVNHLLELTKDIPNVKVNHMGLGSEVVKRAKFYSNVESFQPHPFVDSTHNEGDEFDINTIDEYCEESGVQSIDFVKIDTEGFDFRVLLGAKNMIDKGKVKYIQFEYWDGVRKFYDLLSDQYNMWFMDQNTNELKTLDESMVIHIDSERIPMGMGGDIFCKLK